MNVDHVPAGLLSRAVDLKLYYVSESRGRLVKTQVAGPHLLQFLIKQV